MSRIRRLQYIGKQHLINVPASLVKESQWRKGDHIELVRLGNESLGVRKLAECYIPRDNVLLASLEAEAQGLFALVCSAGPEMHPGYFSGYQARLSYITAKMRRLRIRARTKMAQGVETAMPA